MISWIQYSVNIIISVCKIALFRHSGLRLHHNLNKSLSCNSYCYRVTHIVIRKSITGCFIKNRRAIINFDCLQNMGWMMRFIEQYVILLWCRYGAGWASSRHNVLQYCRHYCHHRLMVMDPHNNQYINNSFYFDHLFCLSRWW